MSVCLYSCPSYPECKSHLFCVALCYYLWCALALRYFSTLNDKRQDFRKKKKKKLNVNCVLIFCIAFV